MREDRLNIRPCFNLGLRQPGPSRTIAWCSSKRVTEISYRSLSPKGCHLLVKQRKTACKPSAVLQQSRIFRAPEESLRVGLIGDSRLFPLERPPLIQGSYRGPRREHGAMCCNTRNSRKHEQTTDKKTGDYNTPADPPTALKNIS